MALSADLPRFEAVIEQYLITDALSVELKIRVASLQKDMDSWPQPAEFPCRKILHDYLARGKKWRLLNKWKEESVRSLVKALFETCFAQAFGRGRPKLQVAPAKPAISVIIELPAKTAISVTIDRGAPPAIAPFGQPLRPFRNTRRIWQDLILHFDQPADPTRPYTVVLDAM